MPEGTKFFPFPKPGKIRQDSTEWEKSQAKLKTEKARRWQYLCGRKDFSRPEQITKDTYICSLHFAESSGPTDEHPEPLLACLTDKEAEARMKRKRKPAKDRCSDGLNEKIRKKSHLGIAFDDKNDNIRDDEKAAELPGPSGVLNDGVKEKNQEKATQTVYDNYILGAKIETMLIRNRVKVDNVGKDKYVPKNSMLPESILTDKKKAKFFTGLFPLQFDALYNFLGPAKFELVYWKGDKSKTSKEPSKSTSNKMGCKKVFTLREELFITLLKLRRGFTHQTIAYMYDVSVSLISSIFITWIQFIYLHFKEIKYPMFPSKEDLKPFLPKVFKPFRNVRCSIDCTEFFCQTPRDYAHQGNVYSSYKHHATFKALIAVTPNGSACFISDLYEGSIDDVSITSQCGILDHIEPGDVLLVDKGFTIQELLYAKQATIKIPAFLGKRDKLTKEEEMATRRIAKARIHVERFNERLKKFLLVGRTIPLSLIPIASQLVYVASCLVNFQAPLCK